VAHIAEQVTKAVEAQYKQNGITSKLLATGGGAFNTFLMEQLQDALRPFSIDIVVPDAALVAYKEALIMALIGVLRWRQEYTVLPSVTGAATGKHRRCGLDRAGSLNVFKNPCMQIISGEK
jgi:anhydro-N-acetylmuramic acid kinase